MEPKCGSCPIGRTWGDCSVGGTNVVDGLRARGGTGMQLYRFGAIVEHVEVICRPGDLVVIMGAGPVWQVGHAFLHIPDAAREDV